MSVAGGRSGKLTAGGVLCILAAAINLFSVVYVLLGGGGYAVLGTSGGISTLMILLTLLMPIIGIVGGYYALRRKNFWWAILGALSAILFLSYIGIALGAAALILILLSRKEFA